MKKPFAFVTAIIFLIIINAFGLAQENKSNSAPQPPSAQQNEPQAPARDTYRLEYTITETEDGKKLNSRTYTIVCEDRGALTRGELKVGSRVPLAVSGDSPDTHSVNTQFQYLDVGMNIDARLEVTASGELSLHSEVDMSSIPESGSLDKVGGNPVIRHFRVTSFNAVAVGRPVVITTADDVASHRQFQVQVTSTRIK
jgi:hypothetical protein